MKIIKKLFRSEDVEPGVSAIIARGDAARDKQDWSAAATAYKDALALAPSLTPIRVQYAHVLKEDGRATDAIEAYRRAAEEAPDDADVRVHLAHALKQLGRDAEAISMFSEAVDLNPSDRESADEIFHLSRRQHTIADLHGTENGRNDPSTIATLEDLSRSISSGVSVVTCARNRTENLLRALPSWLACEQVDEVIIVDWTSDEPVHDALAAVGLLDPRVKVIRIEDEPRWVLSVAFNAGFRAASCDKILKVDADIVLNGNFFEENQLVDGAFIAGNWRDAEPGQEFINGFFLIRRANLMEVNGFNELIVTYGWDDDDIYDRLQASGLRRVSVKVSTITHLSHDDAARLELKTDVFPSADAEFWSQPSAKISANRFMCFLMPTWGKGMALQSFEIEEKSGGLFTGRRNAPPPHITPDQVRRDAERYTTAEFLSTRIGGVAYHLTQDQLDILMSTSSLDAVTPLAITLAHKRPDRLAVHGNYLIVRVGADLRNNGAVLINALAAVEAEVEATAFGMVVVDADAAALDARLGNHTPVPLLNHAPGAAAIPVAELKGLADLSVAPGECRELHLTAATALALVPDPAAAPQAAPAARLRRDTLYLDAQHGLGNRLRAIASGAAVADATDRDLVIVWEPDHHCQCDLTDLFDYAGPVLTTAFTDEARNNGLAVFNYMEIEEDSNRGAPVALEPGVSTYARSAYVLHHPASDWAAENAFLRGLTPTRNVMDLVDSVRTPNDVSVHVRMEAAPGTDIHSYDSPDNWPEADHATLQKWRAKSHFSNFMARLDQMIEAGKAETIFLAADLPETYAAFTETYGDRVRYLERALYDRSREQMYYALADAILLSRSKAMLGSNWSSFSEVALRLSTTFDRIQLSGEDF